MFLTLASIFPTDVCRLILIYEGRVESAWIKTYVAAHYRRTMQDLFGWRFSFSQALGCHTQFYANALANSLFRVPIKKRIPRRFIAPYLADIQRYNMSKTLNDRRIAYAQRHRHLFHVYLSQRNSLLL